MAEPRVLVVIPAYNEEQSVAHVLLRLRGVAPEYDRVVVDDGSTDAMGDDGLDAPISVEPHVYGHSMHSLASAFQYPVKTLVLVLVAVMDVLLTRRAR